jgi:hypothetical protein
VDRGYFLQATHGMTPNGGAKADGSPAEYVNEYTIMWRVKFSNADEWNGLLQTDPANSNDADVFVHAYDMGQSWSGESATDKVTNDQWHVLVISMKIGEDGFGRYYINGEYAQTNSGEPGNTVGRAHDVDGNSAIQALVLFMADNDGEDPNNSKVNGEGDRVLPNTIDVAEIAIWDVAFTDADVTKLQVKLNKK